MKKLILSLFFTLCCMAVSAQIKATTESGDKVVLYENGTWGYMSVLDTILDDAFVDIPHNPAIFKKIENANFLLKSKRFNVDIWLNKKEWSYKKLKEDSEYQFVNLRDGLFAMLITEKESLPIEFLKEAVLINAREAASDVKIIKEEYRKVNDLTVLMMQTSLTIDGIKFIYYGYYYSNENGSAQLVVYSTENIIKKQLTKIEKFLNGFVEINKK